MRLVLRLLGFSLPASLVHIGGGAFLECPLSAGLMIPENCPMLDLSATENHRSSCLLLSKDNIICYSSLGIHQTIAIPPSVEVIASRCFSCSHTFSYLGFSDSSLKYIGVRAFWMSSVKSIALPSSVEVLDSLCFCQCRKLSIVTFVREPSSVRRIGQAAFKECVLH